MSPTAGVAYRCKIGLFALVALLWITVAVAPNPNMQFSVTDLPGVVSQAPVILPEYGHHVGMLLTYQKPSSKISILAVWDPTRRVLRGTGDGHRTNGAIVGVKLRAVHGLACAVLTWRSKQMCTKTV